MGGGKALKPALLVIDLQEQFYQNSDVTVRSLDDAIEYVNAAIELFREKGLPIVVIQHRNDDTGLVPGSQGFEVPESIKLLPGDQRITKTYGNAFNKTPLAEMLRGLGVDTVIVTGYCAEHCVLSTYRGAKDCDLTPIILRGSLASGRPERIRFVEEISEIVSYGALKAILPE